MKYTRKTFVFNAVWYEIIENCSSQVKGEVFASVMEYALFGKMPENICNEANVIFQFIKIEIDRREKRRLKSKPASDTSVSSESSEISESSENSEKTNQLPLTRQQRRYLERHPERVARAS